MIDDLNVEGRVNRPAGAHTKKGAIGVVAGVATVAMLVALSLWLGPRLRSPQQAAAEAAPPSASLVTVLAEERVLAEALVLRGRVTPGAGVKLTPPAGGVSADSVVTKVKVRKGEILGEGRMVLERSGQPMMTLVLPFPLYRDLVGGMSGPDVVEVQKALRRLGYTTSTNGRLDAATQRALAKWWAANGYQVPSGKSAELPSAQAAYDQAIASGAGVAAAKKALEEAKVAAGPSLPRAAVLRLTRAGSKITAVRVRVGTVLDKPDVVLLELDGGSPYVATTVTKEQVALLTAGQQATILDEVSGKEAQAKVATIGTEAVPDDQSGTTGFPVTLAFAGAPLNAAERSVRIDITSAASVEPQLAVPITAVYSRPDGSTFVTVAPESGKRVDVTVVVTQSGGGWVAITPTPADAVTVGTPVVVGRA